MTDNKGYLEHVQQCLRAKEKEMAGLMGISRAQYRRIKRLPMSALADTYTHPMWQLLAAHIDLHVGGLMAARAELQAKRAKDHKARLARQMRTIT